MNIATADAKTELSESITKNAIEKLDWLALRAHCETVILDEQRLHWLLGHVRRTNSLIHQRPNPTRETRRNNFLTQLSAYLEEKLGTVASKMSKDEALRITQIERGYHDILTSLGKCDISSRPPAVRIAACIARSLSQYAHLRDEVQKELKKRTTLHRSAPFMLESAEKVPYSADGVVNTLVDILSMTIMMEAHKNDWFTADGYVQLPSLPEVTETDQYQAGSTEILATHWRRWERVEERLRFMGGELQELKRPDLPAWCPPTTQTLLIYTPTNAIYFDYTANHRLYDIIGQNYMAMVTLTNVVEKISSIASHPELLPTAYIDEMELHAAETLTQVLGYDIIHDQDRPGGLRLVEWLRGYTVLQEIATRFRDANTETPEKILIIKEAELHCTLQDCGMAEPYAKTFIMHATLKKGSRDLFDSPLTRLSNDDYMLFTPASCGSNMVSIVLSAISALEVSLSKRGKAFERSMLAFFVQQGLAARTLTFKRDGKDYEYDVIVDWEDHLFVIECKNYALSGNKPSQAYWFEMQLHKHCRQVNRLVDALRRYPEIIQERFGWDIANKKIIPVVMHSLPYSRAGMFDGAYITDAFSVRRFFAERCFHVAAVRKKGPETHLHRSAIKSIWKGDKPTPEDFVEQFESPFQLRVAHAHTEVIQLAFALGETTVGVSREFSGKEHSVESMREVSGVSSDTVKKGMGPMTSAI